MSDLERRKFMKILKILIVDDEEMLRDLYEMIIESEFTCEMTKVANGAEAVDVLNKVSDFDLIISDYTMPKLNGGQLYLFNKTQKNIPFLLFSGGDLQDYAEFQDFYKDNLLNGFFNKPFDERHLLDAIAKIGASFPLTESKPAEEYIRIKLSYYISHTKNAADVYLKLSNDKYVKIINDNVENIPEKDLLEHYLKKGVDYIYVESDFFKKFLNDIFDNFQASVLKEKMPETQLVVSGLNFHVSFQGLNNVGISDFQITKVNQLIEVTVDSLLNNPKSRDQFIKLCKTEGFSIGHSLLIMYIAGRIAQDTSLNFAATMPKICTAAFYHDISLFDLEILHEQMKIENIEDRHLLRDIMDHPMNSTNFLPADMELVEDTKKIMMEHHELPTGLGYPKKLTASQISPLSCLFILSEQISLCLIRNNFSHARLKDFLLTSQSTFNQGNFSSFYDAAKTIF
jgi:response regulator RpfG family c-di-GMP phosphodiesterase